MHTRPSLQELYQQWHDLTTAEGHAIEREDWDGLEGTQLRKAELKLAILEQEKATAERPAGLWTWLRTLIDMERHNLEALERRKVLLRQEIAGLDASSRTLHRIKGAYGHSAPAAAVCFGSA